MKNWSGKKQQSISIETMQRSPVLLFRNNSKSVADKAELSTELHQLIGATENYRKLVTAHDTARIVQCMLKHSVPDIQRQIAEVDPFSL